MKKKPREFWLAMPGDDYDGCPGAWPLKELAERSHFVVYDKKGVPYPVYPSEVIHVKEVLNEKTNRTKLVSKSSRAKRAAPTKRRPNAKRARKKDL